MSVRTCVTPGFFDSENRITRIIIPYSPEKFSFEQKHIDKRESGRNQLGVAGVRGVVKKREWRMFQTSTSRRLGLPATQR